MNRECIVTQKNNNVVKVSLSDNQIVKLVTKSDIKCISYTDTTLIDKTKIQPVKIHNKNL